MLARSPWWILGSLTLALGGVLVAGYAGWLGPLTTCGADGATVCIVWPGVASAVTWLVFLGTLACLAAWQAQDWRSTSVERREIVWLGIVLAAALVERTWRVFDLAQVAFDEASAASLVAAWHFQGLFPLTGIISSVGIPNPPGLAVLVGHRAAAVRFAVRAGRPGDRGGAALGRPDVVGGTTLARPVGCARGGHLLRRWILGGVPGPGRLAAGVPAVAGHSVPGCADGAGPSTLAMGTGHRVRLAGVDGAVALHRARLRADGAAGGVSGARALRPVHLAAAAVTATLLLTPFLLYELNPVIRFRDLGPLLGDAGGPGAHWDLESLLLSWTLVSNGGVAGLGGPDSEGLRLALGRWASVSLIGIPLVGCGLLAAVAGWPRGWRGWLIAAWVLIPIVGLARHTLGILFHYLYAGLPGMALAVGALVEFSFFRLRRVARLAIGGALAAYVAVSAAMLWVVLDHVDRTGQYPGLGKPLGLNMAAADVARAAVPPGGQVLVGGYYFEVEILRFCLGYGIPSRLFDDCGAIPLKPQRCTC